MFAKLMKTDGLSFALVNKGSASLKVAPVCWFISDLLRGLCVERVQKLAECSTMAEMNYRYM